MPRARSSVAASAETGTIEPYARKQTSLPSRTISPRAGISCERFVERHAEPEPPRIADRQRAARLDRGEKDVLQLVLVLGRRNGHVRYAARIADVEDSLVRLPVVADEARAVDADRDGQRLDGNVVDELVERALEERRVDRDDGLPAFLRHARGHDDGVLLGDPDVVDALGKMLPHFRRPVPSSIAALIATIFGSFAIIAMSVFAKTWE